MLGVNLVILISLISISVLLICYRETTIQYILNRNMLTVLILLICSIVVLFVAVATSTKNFDYLKNIIYLLVGVLPTSIFLSVILHQKKMTISDLFDLLLIVAVAQSLIVLATFIFPNLKEIILHTFYYNTYVVGEFSHVANSRIFGFTGNFTYAMPVVQGFMAFVAFVYAVTKTTKYFIYIPLLLFSAAVNARVGLVVFAISIIVFMMLYLPNIDIRKAIGVLRAIVFVLLGIIIVIYFIGTQSAALKDWILRAYQEIKALFAGEAIGYFSALERFIFFPEGIDLVFGIGHDYFNVSHTIYQSSTDVGYVNDLFLGGIVFVLFLYSAFLKLYLSWQDNSCIESRYFPITIVLVSLVLNIKGYAFRFNEFVNLFVLISVFALFNKTQAYREKTLKQ